MAEHDRKRRGCDLGIAKMQVGAADRAGGDLQAELARLGLGIARMDT
jgi:hypothetical protein